MKQLTYILLILAVIFVSFCMSCSDDDATGPDDTPDTFLTPQEVLPQMMRGINMGNTLEPPDEGGWNTGPAQEYYFDDYKSAGFDCVRVPVRWGTHTAEAAPFTIDPDWLARVAEVIDWGLERDLYIILNAHHEEWLKADYSEFNKTRFDSIWAQVSRRFQDRSGKLLFEMINEPHGLTIEQVNDLNFRILSIIRQTNPQRIVVFSGHDYSNLEHMIQAAIPPDDYVMAYYHSYDPWNFAGEGEGIWGNTSDRAAVEAKFEQAAGWANAFGVPVMISEFGAVQACDYNSRMLHYATYVEKALANDIAFQVWDDDGNFGIYDRAGRTWPEVADILLHAYPDGPTLLQDQVEGDSVVVLSWQNRTSAANEITIQRRTRTSDYADVAQLSGSATEYRDADVVWQEVYFYRVIARVADEPDRYSYPLRVFVYNQNMN